VIWFDNWSWESIWGVRRFLKDSCVFEKILREYLDDVKSDKWWELIFIMIWIISSNLFIMNFNWSKWYSKVINEFEKYSESLSLEIERLNENYWIYWKIIRHFILHLITIWIMIDNKSLNWISSKSSYRNDIPSFRGEVIVKNKKDMKIYTLNPSENEIHIWTQSPSICNVNISKVERLSQELYELLVIFTRSIYNEL